MTIMAQSNRVGIASLRGSENKGCIEWHAYHTGQGYVTNIHLFRQPHKGAFFIEREYTPQSIREGATNQFYSYERGDDGVWCMITSDGGEIVFDDASIPIGVEPHYWDCVLPFVSDDPGVERIFSSFLQVGEGLPEEVFSDIELLMSNV